MVYAGCEWFWLVLMVLAEVVVDGCGCFWLVLAGCGSFWVALGGFGPFLVLVCMYPCIKGKPTEHEFQRSRPLFQMIFLCYLLPPL